MSFFSNEKAVTNHLIAAMIKYASYKMSQYLPKPYEHFGRDINIKVDLSNYAIKTDLKKLQERTHLI